jgi:O-antigen ligase
MQFFSDFFSPQKRWQWLIGSAICLIPLLSPHQAVDLFWTASIPPDTYILDRFRSVLLALIDIPLYANLIFLLLGIVFSAELRHDLGSALSSIIRFQGGIIWLAFLLWTGISIFWAKEPLLAGYTAFHLMAEMGLAVCMATLVQVGWGKNFLYAFTLAATFHAVIAIAQMVHGDSLGLAWLGEIQRNPDNPFGFGVQPFRPSAFAFHPNHLAGFLVIGLFAGVFLMLSEKGFRRWLTGCLTGLIALGLLGTASRTALVGVGAALLIASLFALYILPHYRFSKQKLMWGGFGILIALILVISVGTVSSTLRDRMSVFLEGPDTLGSRLTYAFPDTTAIIADHQFIGVGSGNLMVAIGELRAGSPEYLLPAHNVYWIVWAELGIVGLSLFVLNHVFIVMHLHPANPIEVIGWGLCWIATMAILIGDYYLWGDLSSRVLLFWVLGMWWGYSLPHNPVSAAV